MNATMSEVRGQRLEGIFKMLVRLRPELKGHGIVATAIQSDRILAFKRAAIVFGKVGLWSPARYGEHFGRPGQDSASSWCIEIVLSVKLRGRRAGPQEFVILPGDKVPLLDCGGSPYTAKKLEVRGIRIDL